MPKSSALLEPDASSNAVPTTHAPSQPNKEGVFETYEKVMIAGLPVQTCGEIYIAEWFQLGVTKFFVGYFMHMRQPANTAKALPNFSMPSFPSREAAIVWVIDSIAANFFSDHKAAMAKLKAWRSKVVVGSAVEPPLTPEASEQPKTEAKKKIPDLVIVGCVASKNQTPGGPIPAQTLYTGALWERRKNYAVALGRPWMILSAEAGLIGPEHPLSCYDTKLLDLSEVGHSAVVSLTRRALIEHFGGKEEAAGHVVEVHAGKDYVAVLNEAACGLCLEIVTPMAGKGIGEQLAAYRKKDSTASDISVVPAIATTAPSEAAQARTPGRVQTRYEYVQLIDIEPNPKNPRKDIPLAELEELAASIKAPGFLLNAIAVRDLWEGAEDAPAGMTCARFRLIAGERRWRAHQLLGWVRIESKVFWGCSDELVAELALIENLQRRDLNPMEEAEGFDELQSSFGYSLEKIVERTGKSESTIKNALRIVALAGIVPAAGNFLRTGELSVRCAKRLAAARWTTRPEHCAVLVKLAVTSSIERLEFENAPAATLTRAAATALAGAKLAVNISNYREHIDPANLSNVREEHESSAHGRRGSEIMQATDGTLWHLAPDFWKEEKRVIDKSIAEKRAEEEKRAAKKVTAAAEGGVNVRVEDLARAGATFKQVEPAELRYVPYLPADFFTNGLDAEEREVVICLKPFEFAEALAKLQVGEAELIAADRRAKIPLLHDDATAALKRLKRIGSREVAFLLSASSQFFADGRAWDRQGVTPPAEDLSRAQLATVDPVDLVRVSMESLLMNSSGGELFDALRWILNVQTLGLAEEYEQSREEILAKAAATAFPKVTTDPKTLAEWQKARGLGMPFTEIARSYSTTIEDVCGALGESVPQRD